MNWVDFIDNRLESLGGLEFVAKFVSSSEDERIDLFLKNEQFRRKVKQWTSVVQERSSRHLKCQKESLKHRDEGNKCFGRGNYNDALTYYSKSILYAPHEGDSDDCLSIGHANRSAAHFNLGRFHDCLEDVASSIDAGYPQRLLLKLQVRKARCLINLNRFAEGAKEAEIGLQLIENDETLARERKAEICSQLSDVIGKGDRSGDPIFPNSRFSELKISNGANPVRKSMSAALEVKESAKYGRHVVTKEAIKAGDVLFVEKPFASVLLPDFNRSHCQHCHTRVDSCFPCKKCTQVVYCSRKCQRESWDVYHSTECGQLDLLQATGLGHLVFRIVLVAGLPYLLSKRRGRKFNVSSTSESSECEPYLAVHSLVTNAKLADRRDLLLYAMTGMMLTSLIESELENDEDRAFICSLMLRHSQQIVCNAHAIDEVCRTVDVNLPVENQTQVRMASAVYPTASLLNHSCDPTVTLSFSGDVLIARSVKDVSIGGQIYTCYGPHYRRMSTADRKSALFRQYFFDCDCMHCGTDENSLFKCFECNDWMKSDGRCNGCGKLQDCSRATREIERSRRLFSEAERHLHSGRLEDAFVSAEECLLLQKLFLFQFHRELGKTYDFVGRLYATKGRYKRSSEYVLESLTVTEHNYGAESIELANEIVKYTDVAFRALTEGQIGCDYELSEQFVNRLVAKLQRGIRIFKVHYGSSNEFSRELIDKLECLTVAQCEN